MSALSKRLPLLFLLAFLGVLVLLGVGVRELAGWPAAVAYAGVVVTVLGLGGWRFRPRPAPAHSGCSCCSGEPFRGVEVV